MSPRVVLQGQSPGAKLGLMPQSSSHRELLGRKETEHRVGSDSDSSVLRTLHVLLYVTLPYPAPGHKPCVSGCGASPTRS